jgi:hypothetical protein
VLGPRNKDAAGELDDPTEDNLQLSEDLQLLAHRLERECFYIIFKVRALPPFSKRFDFLVPMTGFSGADKKA